ncbi:unnamed protein product, partial [Ectocarpus sp. 12 AP-2014]
RQRPSSPKGNLCNSQKMLTSPPPDEFSEQMLEGGTWKAGRYMAKMLRPQTCGPPIEIVSDGTVF